MALQAVYDSKDDIPAEYAELYSERGGKWECTGIAGMKTLADVERVTVSLTKEREDHKATKAKLAAFSELGDLDDVQKKLDRIPELEAASKGKLDEAAIEEIVERRVQGTLASKIAPVERENRRLKTANEELTGKVGTLTERENTRQLHDAVRPVANGLKVLPEHLDDVLMYAERHFERTEDGNIQTRDGVGVTPGLDPKAWLEEFVEKRPGWLPPDVGGGARGSDSRTGPGGRNPWAAASWNLTEQGQYVKEHGLERAETLAKAAGTKVGGTRPAQAPST